MRKIILITTFICVINSLRGQKLDLSFNFIPAIFSTYSGAAFFSLSENVYLGAAYGIFNFEWESSSFIGGSSYKSELKGNFVCPELRFYFKNRHESNTVNAYIGFYLKYRKTNYTVDIHYPDSRYYEEFSLGLTNGIEIYSGNYVSISLWTGMGMFLNDDSNQENYRHIFRDFWINDYRIGLSLHLLLMK